MAQASSQRAGRWAQDESLDCPPPKKKPEKHLRETLKTCLRRAGQSCVGAQGLCLPPAPARLALCTRGLCRPPSPHQPNLHRAHGVCALPQCQPILHRAHGVCAAPRHQPDLHRAHGVCTSQPAGPRRPSLFLWKVPLSISLKVSVADPVLSKGTASPRPAFARCTA